MKVIFKISFFLVIVLFLTSCFKENEESSINTSINDKSQSRQNMSFSPNKQNSIYTEFNEFGSQKIVISIEGDVINELENNFIAFSPVINNNGDFAYAVSEYSTSESKVYINNKLIEETNNQGLYKYLDINDKYLAYSYSRLYDETEFIVIYDIETKKVNKKVVDGIIQKVKFLSDNKLLLEIYNIENNFRTVYLFDVSKNEVLDRIETFSNEIFLDEVLENEQFIVKIIEGSNSSKNLYNSYYLINSAMLNSDFSRSNNFMGRITWNETYRLEAMVKLYLLTKDLELKNEINKVVRNIMEGINYKSELGLQDNPKFAWATTKYSIDRNTAISLIVDDSLVFYSLLFAARNNIIVDEVLKNEIINSAKEFYNYHENNFDSTENLYRIPYGIEFHLDGVLAPYNWQNSFGLMLIELYNLTGEETYKTRAFQLAKRFKSEMEYTEDNRLLWHYWPQNFYKGWNKEDRVSKNTSSKEKYLDELYEDFSHAGLNLKFIIEFNKTFGDDIFTKKDIELISNTLNGMIYDKNTFSRFISGDTEYQEPSFQFIPKYGWTELDNNQLNSLYENLLPHIYPEFDSQELAVSYVNLIKDIDFNETIKITSIKYNRELEELERDTVEYKLSEIKNLFFD